jgi:plastocyanin
MPHARTWVSYLILGLVFSWPGAMGEKGEADAVGQSEQVVEVTIKEYKFLTKQSPLRLGLPTVIKVRNEDTERHDFGSTMFEGLSVKIEKDGVIVYGRGLSGVFLDPKRDATVRFDLMRPGRHEFRCSIHPTMSGELLILSTEAV